MTTLEQQWDEIVELYINGDSSTWSNDAVKTLLDYIAELKSANQHLREGMENLAGKVVELTGQVMQWQGSAKAAEMEIAELRRSSDGTSDCKSHRDTARLDWIDSECADLRCQVRHYHDDADTYYQVVTFQMAAPKERCVGEACDPRKAIDMAMAGAVKTEIKVLERAELPLTAPEQPYIVQGLWSPCRKYIASVHLSNGEITVQDDNGDVWRPTGPAQNMAAE